MLGIESGTQGHDQLEQNHSQENPDIDDNQPGDRIARLKLVAYIV